MNPSAKYLIPFLALALAGCSEPEKQEFPDEPRLVKASIRVGTSPMENLPLLPAGKSNTQMRPEDLNPIKTLAVFQYDPEGNFVLSDYHDYTNNGQSTGEMNVQLETQLAAYNDNSTVCLVANMPREECDSIATSCLFLRDFQDYTTEVPYSGRSETSLGYGLMESSYMSGYYEGPITEGMDISAALGRIISNVSIGISLGEGWSYYDMPRSASIQLQNIPRKTFLFPPDEATYENSRIERGHFNEEAINTLSDSEYAYRYYYVAGFAALDSSDACNLHIQVTMNNGSIRSTDIPLGNDAPGTENRNYTIYRNSNYTFNLRLVPAMKDSGKAIRKGSQGMEIEIPL